MSDGTGVVLHNGDLVLKYDKAIAYISCLLRKKDKFLLLKAVKDLMA